MRNLTIVLIAMIIGTLLAEFAAARRPRRRAIKPTTPAMLTGTDQQRAEAEVNYMASHDYRGHVGKCIGNFEGVGWSTETADCATCEPGQRNGLFGRRVSGGSNMVLSADASARAGGLYYRVRAWRPAGWTDDDQPAPEQVTDTRAAPDQSIVRSPRRGWFARWAQARRDRRQDRRNG